MFSVLVPMRLQLVFYHCSDNTQDKIMLAITDLIVGVTFAALIFTIFRAKKIKMGSIYFMTSHNKVKVSQSQNMADQNATNTGNSVVTH